MLKKQNLSPLSKSDGSKNGGRYSAVCAGFAKRKALDKAAEKNESLGLFVSQLP